MKITEDIKYIGVNDYCIDLFEGQYKVPDGMSYNSYVIMDEKIAVMDTVDGRFEEKWLKNLETVLLGKEPDYLIVQHMEPDHSANVLVFAEKYPSAKIVSSKQSFNMMKNFFGTDFENRRIVVGEGDKLELGKHTLNFITATMVHWPEVIMAYDTCDKVLFSADGFGKFGAIDKEDNWIDEARRYYFGIVGKYGMQVGYLLKKVAGLDIKIVCPLHGVILFENLGYYTSLYDVWSKYEAEKDGVVIAFASMHGNTKRAAGYLCEECQKRGIDVKMYDLARCDTSFAVADCFKYDKVVLAANTYNMGVNPFMRDFIQKLTERNFQNRKVAFIENGSWFPLAGKVMGEMLEGGKNLEFLEPVTIMSAMNEENKKELSLLAEKLCR